MAPLTGPKIERVFREEFGRAVAVLVRRFGDIDLAEETVQDAFAIALERWPTDGLPPSPAGWIITTARNQAINRLRREASREERHARAVLLQSRSDHPPEEESVHDDRLRLIFTYCHLQRGLHRELGRSANPRRVVLGGHSSRATAGRPDARRTRSAGAAASDAADRVTPAREDRASGELVLLANQDRDAWDPESIAEGHGMVRKCLRLNRPGAYQIQAAINAVHSDAASGAETDWRQDRPTLRSTAGVGA